MSVRQPQIVGSCRSGACGRVQPRFQGGCSGGGCGQSRTPSTFNTPNFGCTNGSCGTGVAQAPLLATPFEAAPIPSATSNDFSPASQIPSPFFDPNASSIPQARPAQSTAGIQSVSTPTSDPAAHSGPSVASQSAEPRTRGGRSYAEEPSRPAVAVDLDFNFGGQAQVCVGILVGKGPSPTPTEPDRCAVAFLTAGHCVKNGSREFRSVKVGLAASGLGGDFTLQNGKDRLAYRQGSLPTRVQTNFGIRTENKPAFDSALVRGSVSCARVARLPVTEIALDEKPEIGDKLSILRRHEPVSIPKVGVVNPGGGDKVTGTLARGDGDHLWKIEGLGNGGIYGGDSGGPVVDAHGHVFSVLSRGEAGNKGSDFALVDSQVPVWTDQVLTTWGFGPESRGGHSVSIQEVRAPASTAVAASAPAKGVASASAERPQTRLTTAQLQVINRYENGMRYPATGNKRYAYKDGFEDIPKGGNGKITIGYFGARRPDLDALVASDPRMEFQNYPVGGPEYIQNKFDGVNAFAIDGLGRKISRYDSPEQALSILRTSKNPATQMTERELLDAYLAARAQSHSPGSQDAPSSTPASRPSIGSIASVATLASIATVSTASFALPQAPSSAHAASTPPPALKVRELSKAFDPAHLGSFVQNQCVQCHGAGKQAPAFPSFVNDWTQWQSLLEKGDPSARAWMQQFNSKVVHGEMVTLAGLNKRSGTGKDFHDFVAAQSDRYLPREPASTSESIGSPGATQMTDPAKLPEYLEVLRNANIGDPKLRSELLAFDSIWDTTGNPAMSWAPHGGDSGRKGARPVATTIPASNVRPELFKFENGQYKWKEPFADGFAADSGTDGLKRFTLVRFPRDAAGNLMAGPRGFENVEKYIGSNGSLQSTPLERGDLATPWASFPPGTRTYEVMYAHVNGKPVAIDIVSREKRLAAGGNRAVWVPDALRADSSPDKIRAWVAAQQDAQTNPDFARILQAVNNPVRDSIRSELGSGNRGGVPFVVDGRRTGEIAGSKSVVRGVSQATLERMYRDLPMESASGSRGWQLEPGDIFSGSHRGIPVNTQSCRNCHESAGQAFKTVFGAARLSDKDVFQYGNVGGYDQVLGAPWFTPQELEQYKSGNGARSQMRPEWAKFFQDYDPKVHGSQYRRSDPYKLTNNPLLPQ